MPINDLFLDTAPAVGQESALSEDSIRSWVAELTDLTPTQVQAVVEEMHQTHSA